MDNYLDRVVTHVDGLVDALHDPVETWEQQK